MMHLYPTLLWDDIIPYERRRIKRIRNGQAIDGQVALLDGPDIWQRLCLTEVVTSDRGCVRPRHLTELVYRGTTSPDIWQSLCAEAQLHHWPDIWQSLSDAPCVQRHNFTISLCSSTHHLTLNTQLFSHGSAHQRWIFATWWSRILLMSESHEPSWCITTHLKYSWTLHVLSKSMAVIWNSLSSVWYQIWYLIIKYDMWSSSLVAICIYASFVNVTSKCKTFTTICVFQRNMNMWSTMRSFRMLQHLFWYGEGVSNMVATYSVSFESVAWFSNLVTNTRFPSNQWFLMCHRYTRPFQDCGWFLNMVSKYYSAPPRSLCLRPGESTTFLIRPFFRAD